MKKGRISSRLMRGVDYQCHRTAIRLYGVIKIKPRRGFSRQMLIVIMLLSAILTQTTPQPAASVMTHLTGPQTFGSGYPVVGILPEKHKATPPTMTNPKKHPTT